MFSRFRIEKVMEGFYEREKGKGGSMDLVCDDMKDIAKTMQRMRKG